MIVMTKPSDLQRRLQMELEEEERRRLAELARLRAEEEERERLRRLAEEEAARRKREAADSGRKRDFTVKKSGNKMITVK